VLLHFPPNTSDGMATPKAHMLENSMKPWEAKSTGARTSSFPLSNPLGLSRRTTDGRMNARTDYRSEIPIRTSESHYTTPTKVSEVSALGDTYPSLLTDENGI
jgi:hypothetical protein